MDVGLITILRDVGRDNREIREIEVVKWSSVRVFLSQVSSLISGRRRPRLWERKDPRKLLVFVFYIPANISKHTPISYRLQMGINQLGPELEAGTDGGCFVFSPKENTLFLL